MGGTPKTQLEHLLPEALMAAVGSLPDDLMDFRLRPNRPAQLVRARADELIGPDVPPELIKKALNLLARHSLYAWEEELRQGFFTLDNGCRVGVCGRFAVEEGAICALSHIGSVSIRIAREVRGAADRLMPLMYEHGRPLSALILSPPGYGKTTLLRDIARQLSGGTPHGAGCRVALADERSELAACASGVPTMDLGPRTDVMDGCPKRIALTMLVRAMSPDVVITDELGHAGDAEAVMDAARCGVKVVASAHAAEYDQAAARPAIAELIKMRAFDRVVVLGGIGRIARVTDGEGRTLGGETPWT